MRLERTDTSDDIRTEVRQSVTLLVMAAIVMLLGLVIGFAV